MGSGLISRSPIDAGPLVTGGPGGCPLLRAGQTDPVGGKDCVRVLQRRLRDLGYPGQRVDGRFGPRTRANVMAFQRASGLRPDGAAGPRTLAALFGGSAPLALSGLDLGSPYCRGEVCHFVVPRGATRQVGNWLANNPGRAVDASADLLALQVCGAARIATIARFGCEKLVEREAGDFIATLRSAAGRNACVRISIGLPRGGTPNLLRFASVTCRS
ncbi:peptidoglycan-binding domain-containing protein [Streptosporangium sp. NPDC002524]|uniref:peptidoglycan-binding domain-containing protein n=1 Tax=Streptosporangium sp. NPDC002524 TaxID=3154537 RepID=UPI0033342798